MPLDLVVATRNEAKLKELVGFLEGLPFVLRSIGEFPDAPEVEETGRTFWENAVLKAEAAHRATGRLALADDSGLEVDALGGAPGVRSSRFSEEGTDQANNAKLLELLAGVPEAERTARFRCVIAIVGGELRRPLRAEGVVEGRIASAAKGDAGFGYDPLFIPEGFEETFAELGPDVKARISHRAKALAEVRTLLSRLAANAKAAPHGHLDTDAPER